MFKFMFSLFYFESCLIVNEFLSIYFSESYYSYNFIASLLHLTRILRESLSNFRVQYFCWVLPLFFARLRSDACKSILVVRFGPKAGTVGRDWRVVRN